MPETKLATATYLQVFAEWRNANFNKETSKWNATGKDFLAVVNAAIKKAGNTAYPSTDDGFDALRAKHNSTRVKYKKTKCAPINLTHSVVEWVSHGPGKKATPVLNHLDSSGRTAYMAAITDVDNMVAVKMPGLPSYEVRSSGGLTGKQMDDLLD